MISQEDYVAQQAGICPQCESNEVEVQYIETIEGIPTPYVECLDCHTVWKEKWELAGYEIIG